MLGIDKANSEFNIINMDKNDERHYTSLDLKDKMEKKSELTYKIEMVDFMGTQYERFNYNNSPTDRKSVRDFHEAR